MDDKNKSNLGRIVLTGGPCCGKTTTLDALTAKGHKVLPEIARLVIEEGVYHPGKGILEFQEEILRRQIEQEEQTTQRAFLDRSALDGVAYSLLFAKHVPSFFFNYQLHNRYDKVFLLDRFPLKNDGVRVEASDEEAGKIHEAITQAYHFHGYTPIVVPIMPVEERVNYILERIE